jgi:hypothetical protein
MRVLSFSFKFSPVGHGKVVTNALLHHAYPRRHQLLFAYDYRYEFDVCKMENSLLTLLWLMIPVGTYVPDVECCVKCLDRCILLF